MSFTDSLYIPTDWRAKCDAKRFKDGQCCQSRCRTQIPNTIACHPVMDKNYHTVLGRPVRLCEVHYRSFTRRAKRLLSLPLMEGGYLIPGNKYGYGSMVIAEETVDWENPVATIPPYWGVMRWTGNVPKGLLERLPHAA